MSSEPLLVVLSSPSGVGKDSVLQRLQELGYPFHYTVTATTRLRRPQIRRQRLLFCDRGLVRAPTGRWRTSGPRRGPRAPLHRVPKAPVVNALAKGQDVILRTNVDGARTIRVLAPGAVLIFIQPPSLGELEERLRRRQTDSDVDIERRLNEVRDEVAAVEIFDYEVVNQENGLDACVQSIAAIVQAEKCRVHRPPLGLRESPGSRTARRTRARRDRPPSPGWRADRDTSARCPCARLFRVRFVD